MSNRGTRNGNTGLEQFGLQPVRRIQPLSVRSVDTNYGFVVNTTGELGYLPMPTQGLAVNERLADSIHLEDVFFNYTIVLGTALTDMVRVIVFQTEGLQPTGLPPAITDLLEFSSVNSPYQTNSVMSFKILYDRSHTMAANANTAIVAEKLVVRPAIRRIDFVPGTVQAYSGQVWYLVIGTNPALTNNFAFISRQNFFSV